MIKLTDEQKRVIGSAANAVWEEIAYDCLEALAFETGKNIDHVSIPKAQVIELVVDANRLEDRIRRGVKFDKVPKEILQLFPEDWRSPEYREGMAAIQKFLKKDVFTYPRYGT